MTFTERLLRAVVLACIFLIPFIVLYVSDWSFFPYVVGKNLLFRLLTEVAFGSWVLLVLFGALPRPRVTRVHVAVGVFIAVVAIADMLGVAPFKSFWSNFERMDGLVTLVHAFVFFIVASSILNTHKLWDMFWATSLSVSVLVGLQAIVELSHGANRIAGSTGNPIYLAVYALFHIFIAVIYAYRHKLYMLKAVYTLVALLNISVLWFTGTRGALLGLVIGVLVTLVMFVVTLAGREHRALRIIAASLIVGMFIITGLFVIFKDSELVQSNKMLKRLSHISVSTADRHSTASLRIMVWQTAWEGVKERPILGWGQENFNYVFNKHYNPRMYEAEQWYDRTHNIFLDWLIAAGALGLLAYIGMYVMLFIEAVRNKYFNSVESAMVVGLLAAYIVHNLFVFDHIVSYILFFSFAAWVHSVGDIEGRVQETISNTVEEGTARLVTATVIGVMLVTFIYAINYPSYMQNRLIIKALRASASVTTIEQAREYFVEASSYMATGTQEVREHFILTAAKLSKVTSIAPQARQRFLVSALTEMQKQIDKYPNDARFPYFTASALTASGQHESAAGYLERALELSPKKVNFLVVLGSNASMRGDDLVALSYYKRALALEGSNTKVLRVISLLEDKLK